MQQKINKGKRLEGGSSESYLGFRGLEGLGFSGLGFRALGFRILLETRFRGVVSERVLGHASFWMIRIPQDHVSHSLNSLKVDV